MTPIETIALVIAAISIIKLIVLMVNPRAWFNVAGKIVASGTMSRIVLLILFAIVLKYLLVEMTIVEIYAASAFTIIVFWLSLAPFRKKIYDAVMDEMTTKSIWKKSWLILFIWLGLTAWVLKDIFA